METSYKIGILWSAWTPKVATRILRDLLALERVARVNHTTLVVGCDEQLKPHLSSLDCVWSDNLLNTNLVRAYVETGESVPDDVLSRVPEGADLEVVSLNHNTESMPGLVVDIDPYANIKFYKDWHPIRESMPLTQKAPPKNGEPLMSPFL